MSNLEIKNPTATDAALAAWLASECGVVLSDQGKRLQATATRRDPLIGKAMERVKSGLLPASDDELLAALVSLEGATQPRRQKGEEAEEMTAERYVHKLRAFPRDLVLYELAHWDDYPPPLGKYFPTWSELKAKLDGRFEFRRRLLPALQSMRPHEPEPISREADLASVEECNAVYKKLMQSLGAKPDERIVGKQPRTIEPRHIGFTDREPTLLEQRIAERERLDRERIERELHADVEQ